MQLEFKSSPQLGTVITPVIPTTQKTEGRGSKAPGEILSQNKIEKGWRPGDMSMDEQLYSMQQTLGSTLQVAVGAKEGREGGMEKERSPCPKVGVRAGGDPAS